MKRNGWTYAFVAALACTAVTMWSATEALAADADGFQPIFDGETLKDWDGDPKFWRVEDGVITGQTTAENPTKGNTFLIWRGGEPGDFELRLKFKIVGGNSGIQYRSRTVDKWVLSGYQADIDSGDRYIGILYEEKARGILALRGKKVEISADGKLSDVGETADDATILGAIKKEGWNEYSIRAEGNHLVQKINGHTTIELTDNDAAKRAMKGLIGLQLHAGPPMTIRFKDIHLKQLGPAKDDQSSVQPSADQDKTARKKVVFVAGKPSHGYGSHEHNAGCLLLAHYLKQNLPGYAVDVHQNGWPAEGASAFDGADSVVVYCDGGDRHLLLPHVKEFNNVMDRGVGLVCLHYGVEVPKASGGEAFLNWIGGYFETHWSVNPHWTANFATLPKHPITRGVQPFEINDEWYFHMRFRPQMENVTPILSAIPPAETMKRDDGPHSGNPDVRAAVSRQQPQHVAWASERPDGGRGFGFTGGHYHWNWGDDNFRRLVLNAIAWTAKDEIPASGVGSETPTRKQLEENQDYPKPAEQALKKKLARRAKQKAEPTTQLVAATNQRAPATAVENLDVHEQLETTLFAAEPMLLSPSNIDVDHRGRVWVCEIVNYRRHLGKRPEGDRILILEDTDGDGQVDSEKVFYQGKDIDSPHGVCVLGNKVIVSAGPHVFCFTDTDGDDKPGQERSLV